jgi:prepilin-type N-terminal cleavage/methylation domain-containing protein
MNQPRLSPVMHKSPTGFTLVELLVVVTIIVVLLALLMPAMGRAIYQANLTVCGSNQKIVANSAISYTFANKRYYPYRGSFSGPGNVRAYLPPIAITNRRASYDLRPMIRTMGLSVNKNFQCALVEPLDLEDLLPDEWGSGNQATWFGWYYTSGTNQTASGIAGATRHQGMEKMGDRFEWGGREFNLLIADWDLYRRWDTSGPNAQAGHPDRKVMWNWLAKRVQLFDSSLTLSFWQSPQPLGPEGRGTLDNNFGYDDGSVRRVTDIELEDDRMVLVPNAQSNDENGYGYQVPRQ